MGQEHTYKQFDAELEAIRSRVLEMGGLVEEQIVDAIEALTTGDTKLADTVIDRDHRVNALEVEIDEECIQIIARRQPTAGDLRMIMMVVKTITDLERIGDEAEKIGRMTNLLYESDQLSMPRFTEIRHMSNIAVDMLKKALDAFARLDVVAAAQVVREDMDLDNEFRSTLRHLITFMMEDPRSIPTPRATLLAVTDLERIGDHAKNMAEYVVFMVKGKDVRHVTIEEIEREAAGE